MYNIYYIQTYENSKIQISLNCSVRQIRDVYLAIIILLNNQIKFQQCLVLILLTKFMIQNLM